jgi:RNA polymerase sigma-70 factor (ECF subfamily)
MAHLTDLYNRYIHLIYGVCLKYLRNEPDSQDMCMQVYEKLPAALNKQDIRNFASWLHVLTKNECLMKLRSAAHRNQQSQTSLSEEPNMELAYSLHHIGEEDHLEDNLVALEKALKELPPEQERCIRLFYLEQKCYKEISETTEYNLKQVKSYIQNGKRNLKKHLQQFNEEV